MIAVNVPPGTAAGTVIKYSGAGDQFEGAKAGDFIFVVAEAPHASFTRSGNDLVYSTSVSLADALGDCELKIKSLDGTVLTVACNEILKPNSSKVIRGAGMPTSTGGRGNLVIRFDVNFPNHLDPERRRDVQRLLKK